MRIHFHGAARFVTGSNHLIETKNGEKFLLDMGLFQGTKQQEELNNRELPYDAKDIDFLLLSHSHIDHSGRIPKLVKDGFTGKIYSTKATRDLSEIMLADSAHIQGSDAERENRKRQRQNKPLIEPLYTQEHVNQAMKLFETYQYGEIFEPTPNIKVRFRDAGHILGSAITEVWITEEDRTAKLVYTGDLGVKHHSLIRDPEFIKETDYLILESTYGDTIHENYGNSLNKLTSTIERVSNAGGTVIIPSFAVGRTQEIIYELNKKYEQDNDGAPNPLRYFVDSPLAVNATKVFMRNTNVLHREAQDAIIRGDNIFAFPNLHYTRTVDESKELNRDTDAKVIISASGMATGGRVVHHLKHNLWNPKNAVIFVGYQAYGTAGQLIKDGIDEIKLVGDWVANKAQIYSMPGFSAHADKVYIKEWLDAFDRKPSRIFLVHGEDREMLPLKDALEKEYDVKVDAPKLNSYVDLNFAHLEEATFYETTEDAELEAMIKLEERLARVQETLDLLGHREIDTTDYDKERREALLRNLNEIEAALLDFNMISGR